MCYRPNSTLFNLPLTHSYQLSKLFIHTGKYSLGKGAHFAASPRTTNGLISKTLADALPLLKPEKKGHCQEDQPNQKICCVYKRSCGVR